MNPIKYDFGVAAAAIVDGASDAFAATGILSLAVLPSRQALGMACMAALGGAYAAFRKDLKGFIAMKKAAGAMIDAGASPGQALAAVTVPAVVDMTNRVAPIQVVTPEEGK